MRLVRPSLALALALSTCASAPVPHRSRSHERAVTGRVGPTTDAGTERDQAPSRRVDEHAAGLAPVPTRKGESDASTVASEAPRLVSGVVIPYPLGRVFRGFARCRGGVHTHQAIDIGGVGPQAGLGTPIVSMGKAEVTFIGKTSEDPEKFGRPDTRRGTVDRGRSTLPTGFEVKGYGRVHFFTREHGSWRTGNLVVTRGLGGPLDGHTIRYMHLGAVHPKLVPGAVLEAGQELGLMGGTGVQESAPHVHIDVEAPDGHRLDVAPLLGLPSSVEPCGGSARIWARRAPDTCGAWRITEDFKSGKFLAHEVELGVEAGQSLALRVGRLAGDYRPVVALRDSEGRLLFDGRSPSSRQAKRAGVRLKDAGGGKITVEGQRAATLTLRIEAATKRQSRSKSSEDALPPRDGRYELAVERTCPAH